MHTLIINTTLLMLCHYKMFQLSRSTTDTFQQQGQQNELPDVKFWK